MRQNKWRSHYFVNISFSFRSFGLWFFPKDSAFNSLQTICLNARHRGKSKKTIVLILRACDINNFPAQNTVFLYLCALIPVMWTNKTTHFVELQKLYLTSMFKYFNNTTLSHNISVTFFWIFKKRAFSTVVFHVLEKFM